MSLDPALQRLVDKDAIRDLVLAYSRAIDRKDVGLLRNLYTADATDEHGDSFSGTAGEYCEFIANALPFIPYSGHHVCNHLIAVDGDTGSGEVYAIAIHLIPDRQKPGALIEDFMCVRYLDDYVREIDGKWRFAKRVVTYDVQVQRPFGGKHRDGLQGTDLSYELLANCLFQRGAR